MKTTRIKDMTRQAEGWFILFAIAVAGAIAKLLIRSL
jgi:hypothetical protein